MPWTHWRPDQPLNGAGLFVGADWDDYWAALSALGPRLRAAYVAEPGVRAPRRPPFVDLFVPLDHPQRTRVIKRWITRWEQGN
jgi:hypothetical protein